MRTHHTPPDVLDSLVDVHARPVVQHVADAGGAVDEPHVVLTSLRHCVEAFNKNNTRTQFSVHFPEGRPQGSLACSRALEAAINPKGTSDAGKENEEEIPVHKDKTIYGNGHISPFSGPQTQNA